jgi:hypothetical protein
LYTARGIAYLLAELGRRANVERVQMLPTASGSAVATSGSGFTHP